MIEKKSPNHDVTWFEKKYRIKILGYKPKNQESSYGSSVDDESGEDEVDPPQINKSKSQSVVHGSNQVEFCEESYSDISNKPASVGLIS